MFMGLGAVSVPLRGKYRGEYYYYQIYLLLLDFLLFPSPCGVNIVANQVCGAA